MFSFNDESELMQLCNKLISFSADFIFFEFNKIRANLVLLVIAIDLLHYLYMLQVKYTFVKGNLKLLMPPTYSLVIQESERGSWHVPVAGETSDESSRTWLCITRSGSCNALANSLNGDNQLSNSNKLETLPHRNNSVGNSDDKLTSVTCKRKERSSSSPEV